jgi:hypothetical protein
MKRVDVTGILYILPYSGWAEIHAEDGLSVFWFSSDIMLKLLPYVNETVIAHYDDSMLALRRTNDRGKDSDAPQLVGITPIGPKKTLTPERKALFEITAAFHHPRCWLTSCENRAGKGSAYCEEHTRQAIAEQVKSQP